MTKVIIIVEVAKSNIGLTIKVKDRLNFIHVLYSTYIDFFHTQEQNDSEGGGWSQVAEVGAGDRKAKIDGLNTGDRWVGGKSIKWYQMRRLDEIE